MYARSRNMKVIVVLRDPVSRILSQATTSSIEWDGQLIVAKHGHTMKVNNDTEPIEWGRYVEYLKMWIQCFPKSQIHIVEWSDIMQRPAQTVHKIEAFLGVPYKAREENFHRDEVKRVYCIRPLHIKRMVCLSQNKGKSPTLSPSVEAMIYRFYSKHNEELFRLLGQRFQWGPGA
uniref:Sulfotransferase domain-containing protein n=1 Tax=Arion vulgaris TaxID=1028688 RepID=A0A0B7B3Y4_9EUPU